jgi:hypothetical protein
MCDSSIVNEDIESSEPLGSFLDKMLDGLLVGQLGCDNVSLPPGLCHLIGSLAQVLSRTCCQDYGRRFLRQRNADRPADSPAGPGDYGDFSS